MGMHYNEHIRLTRRAAFRAAFPEAFGPLDTAWTEEQASNTHVAIVEALLADRDANWAALLAEVAG